MCLRTAEVGPEGGELMAKGISTQGDVLVNMTSDGVDLNQIWAEVQDVLELYNKERSAVVQLLSYPTTQVADAVPQAFRRIRWT